VLPYSGVATIVHIPSGVGKGLTQASLWVAFLLALTVNRRLLFRANAYLALSTLLAATALVVSLRTLHVGSIYRSIRLIGFLATLWALTPWWGRRDLMLLRFHVRCLVAVLTVACVGLLAAPHKAMQAGRLSGVIWPIPATQLAHYAAVATGLAIVMWFSGLMRRNHALVLVAAGLTVLLLSHTRTALVAMILGILVAGLSLFTTRRRVRTVLMTSLVVATVTAVVFAPSLSHWFERGENTATLTSLSGRTTVWDQLVNSPRDKVEVLFGAGLSNNSFGGLPIDSSWLAVYQDQGLVGDAIVALLPLVLLLKAVIVPRGPARALALFLLTYCLIASYTEVGLGAASAYLLDLSVVASLLAAVTSWRPRTRVDQSDHVDVRNKTGL
jgi:O-Antigen ligase